MRHINTVAQTVAAMCILPDYYGLLRLRYMNLILAATACTYTK